MFNGSAGAFGEHGQGTGMGIGAVFGEASAGIGTNGGVAYGESVDQFGSADAWGDHMEAVGDFDQSFDSGYANARAKAEKFVPQINIPPPKKNHLPTFFSTEMQLKFLFKIFEDGPQKNMQYWAKMNSFIQMEEKKMSSFNSWANAGSEYSAGGIRNQCNAVKSSNQKFNANVDQSINGAKAKGLKMDSIINSFKNKLRELSKTDNFKFEYKGNANAQAQIEGKAQFNLNQQGALQGEAQIKLEGEMNLNIDNPSYVKGGGEANIQVNTNLELQKKIELAMSGRTQASFSSYFSKRFETFGFMKFDISFEGIKGRTQAVCSQPNPSIPQNNNPQQNYAENIIIIQNKSYYDFDIKLDVLFRQSTRASIAFRMRDQYNYYAFLIDTITRSKSIIKVTNGRPQILKTVEDGGIILNDWHSIHITMVMSNIKVFIYDVESVGGKSSEKILEAFDNSFIQGGVGIIVDKIEGFCFDNLTVEGLTVWTPWVPKAGFTIKTYTSGTFVEDFKASIEEAWITHEPIKTDFKAEWNNQPDTGLGIDAGIFQKSDTCDMSENKMPSFILKKEKILKEGTLTVTTIPPKGCEEGIVSVVIKYNLVKTKSGQETVSYFLFEMINSQTSGNMYRLRKYQDGNLIELKSISNKNEVPGIEFDLGFTPDKEHKVNITSNGKILTIMVSVENSNFAKIFEYRGMDISEGLIGIGTCKCRARFSEIRLRPPVLHLSEELKGLLAKGSAQGLIIPKGSWEEQENVTAFGLWGAAGMVGESSFSFSSSSSSSSSFSSSSSSSFSASSSSSFSGSSSSSSSSSSSMSFSAQFALQMAQNSFSSSNASISKEFTYSEIINKLEHGSISENGKMMMMESIGSIQNRGWTDSGNSSTRFSGLNEKNSVKEYIIGWEICVITNTTESRLKYCDNLTGEAPKKSCKKDFCNSCCDERIDQSKLNVKHQCVKICHKATAAVPNTDMSDTCINSKNQQNVYSYCDSSMKGKQEGFISKCKLDMCNLCCSTFDVMSSIITSNKAMTHCFENCSNSKFLIKIDFNKPKK
jgi:hypothetical protein